MTTQERQSRPRKPLIVEIAETLLGLAAMTSFIAAVSLMTCCCQFRKPDGTVHVIGNCNTAELQDTCKGVLDPDHQTKVEQMYEQDPKKDEDPDKVYLFAEVRYGETE